MTSDAEQYFWPSAGMCIQCQGPNQTVNLVTCEKSRRSGSWATPSKKRKNLPVELDGIKPDKRTTGTPAQQRPRHQAGTTETGPVTAKPQQARTALPETKATGEVLETKRPSDSTSKHVMDDWYSHVFKEDSLLIRPILEMKNGIQTLTNFSIRNRDFQRNALLGQGSHGTVWSYTSGQLELVVKHFKRHKAATAEKKLSDRLIRGQCKVIRSKFFDLDWNSPGVLVMEKAESLANSPYTREDVNSIMESVCRQVGCLANLPDNPQLYYTDLKPENIMVKTHGKSVADRIALADLGSMAPTNNGWYITSYRLTQQLTGTEQIQFIHADRAQLCLAYILALLESELYIAVDPNLKLTEKQKEMNSLRQCLYDTQKLWTRNRDYLSLLRSDGHTDTFIVNWDEVVADLKSLLFGRPIESKILRLVEKVLERKKVYEKVLQKILKPRLQVTKVSQDQLTDKQQTKIDASSIRLNPDAASAWSCFA